jgi:hypothetical protein
MDQERVIVPAMCVTYSAVSAKSGGHHVQRNALRLQHSAGIQEYILANGTHF